MIPAYFGPRSSPDDNLVVGRFLSEAIWGKPDGLKDFCTMGVFSKGQLVAGTAYHNWHPDDGVIELTSASTTPKWLTRSVVNAMFHLPFNMLSARLAVLRVSEKNTNMRAIARRFGFQETVIPRIRGDDEAECVYTLSASEWQNHRMNKHG